MRASFTVFAHLYSMKTALFHNFSNETFVGYWNGRPRKFEPGESLYMPDYLAKHFAKHLTNRELLRVDRKGNPLYKDGEKCTSPKKPEENQLFMELFNKACLPADEEGGSEEKDPVDVEIEIANKNRGKKTKQKDDSDDEEKDKKPAKKGKDADGSDEEKNTVATSPDDDDDDSDDEESFGGKPKE